MKIKWINPTLDFSIFQENKELPVSFLIPTPTSKLQDLANQAKQKFVETNNVQTNINQKTFYFYSYLKAFFQSAAINDNITNLTLDQALRKVVLRSSDPLFLARIIFFFNISNISNISIQKI